MSMSFSVSGSFDKTEAWLKKLSDGAIFDSLAKYGEMGVSALAAATPKDSGETAASWGYEIVKDGTSWSIIWGNSHIVDGAPIAVMLQVGHGTGTGGYIQGRDYINPVMRPIYDKMSEEGWRVVTQA